MYSRIFPVAALAALATAQNTPNLTEALGSSEDLSALASAINLAPPELVSMLGQATNITILAPSNEAFEKLNASGMADALTDTSALAAVLSYHVLNGTYTAADVTEESTFIPTHLTDTTYANVTGGQRVEVLKQGEDVVFYSGLLMNSTVTQADVNFTGGVIHIVDSLLVPPANVSTTAVAAGLSALVGAVTKANLVEALDTTPDVTIFAPSNEAFQAIGSATGNLTDEQLTSILQYHVVEGTVGYSSLLENDQELDTLADDAKLTIRVEGEDVFVNGAKVVTPNVLVANGVVHVIDNVLNPENADQEPEADAETQAVAFSGASSASDLPLTSGVPTATATIGGGPAAATSEAAASASAASASNPAMPMRTGAMGAAALFAGAGVAFNM